MLTVLMATYNGAKTLPEVLSAHCRLEPPEGGWRLVIVDNGSTDDTRDIIASFRQRLPLTCLLEPRRGQNAARNHGLSSIAGDLIVLTDDDAIPESDWLRQLRRVADSRSAFSIFGGPILPRWTLPPAEWILSWVPMSPTFAILNGVEEGPVPARSVFGPNMAIRAGVFRDGRRFDETIGPKGRDYAMGAETEFLIRLDRAGCKTWHCKSAVVHHIIRSFQMNEKWVLDRAVRFGRGQYRLEIQTSPLRPASVLGIPRYLLLQIAIQSLQSVRARWTGEAEQIFRARWWLNCWIGQLLEARLIKKEQREASGLRVSRRLRSRELARGRRANQDAVSS